MYHTVFWDAGRFGYHNPCFGLYSGGGMWVMGLLVLAILAALTLSIIAIVRTSKHRIRSSEALHIIEERYAKGELTKEEFEIMKKDLR
ncbi:MAG: SHOCT domain-containing protein [Sphaerochaetaceae bacterium]